MRKIINSTYITLDGVVEAPHLWPALGRRGDERAEQIQTELVLSCDAVLMGRRTYDGFAPVWPARSGEAQSDHINAMPKYVVSTTGRGQQLLHDQSQDVRAAARAVVGGDEVVPDPEVSLGVCRRRRRR